jgi:hypothetical protein
MFRSIQFGKGGLENLQDIAVGHANHHMILSYSIPLTDSLSSAVHYQQDRFDSLNLMCGVHGIVLPNDWIVFVAPPIPGSKATFWQSRLNDSRDGIIIVVVAVVVERNGDGLECLGDYLGALLLWRATSRKREHDNQK